MSELHLTEFELRQIMPYDTFESWADELTSDPWTYLFHCGSYAWLSHIDHETAHERPTPHSSETNLLRMVYAVSEASSPTLHARILRETTVELVVGGLPGMAVRLRQLEKSPIRCAPYIILVPQQDFYVRLRFSHGLAALLKDIKGRVGPGSGWASICLTLDVVKQHEVLS